MTSPQSSEAAGAEPPAVAIVQKKPIENGVSEASDAPTEKSTSSSPSKAAASAPASSPSKRAEPKPFVYDPNKISLKFIFANRDGINVIVECNPADTVGEVKGALLSMWPEELPDCSGGDKIRLICMGKGMLSPDTKTLEACDVPVFKTHATPVNVAVRPEQNELGGHGGKKGSPKKNAAGANNGGGGGSGGDGAGGAPAPGSSGCSCTIL